MRGLAYLLALIPATALVMGGYIVMFVSNRSEGNHRTFGRYLSLWAFTLAGLVILGALFAAAAGGGGGGGDDDDDDRRRGRFRDRFFMGQPPFTMPVPPPAAAPQTPAGQAAPQPAPTPAPPVDPTP
jgi:hypothetical protein